MTQLLALPFVCSATVVVMAFLGVRPIIMAVTLPFLLGSVWVLA